MDVSGMIASLKDTYGTSEDLPVVVTFFTNERYATCARELETSLLNIGIRDYDFQPRKSQGDHKTNLHQKYDFILEMLDKWKSRAVLWVDADAYIRQWPWLLDSVSYPGGKIPFDFACARGIVGRSDLDVVMGGTLFFANTNDARLLLHEWALQTIATPKRYDFENLSRAIVEVRKYIKTYNLPLSYCWVDRWFRIEGMPTSPVIEHLAISQG